MTTLLAQVFAEERAEGFTELSSIRLVAACLEEASDRGVKRDAVRTVRGAVEYLGATAARRRDDEATSAEESEQLAHVAALTPGLLDVLDALLGPAPDTAWARWRSLQAGAQLGML